MKNYYEILEINEKASQEIIEKVYKVLVKKYHPDLQENAETKTKYEEKIKEINEAYEILSNEEKRKEYDAKLELERQKHESYSRNINTSNNVQNNNINNNSAQHTYYSTPKTQYSNINYNSSYSKTQQNPFNQDYSQAKAQAQQQYQEQLRREQQYRQDYQNAINQAYQDAYIQDMKNRGYRIKYKKTKKDYLRSLIALLITIGIIMIIANLPFVQNYFKDLYNNNGAFKQIVDFFGNMFK